MESHAVVVVVVGDIIVFVLLIWALKYPENIEVPPRQCLSSNVLLRSEETLLHNFWAPDPLGFTLLTSSRTYQDALSMLLSYCSTVWQYVEREDISTVTWALTSKEWNLIGPVTKSSNIPFACAPAYSIRPSPTNMRWKFDVSINDKPSWAHKNCTEAVYSVLKSKMCQSTTWTKEWFRYVYNIVCFFVLMVNALKHINQLLLP